MDGAVNSIPMEMSETGERRHWGKEERDTERESEKERERERSKHMQNCKSLVVGTY